MTVTITENEDSYEVRLEGERDITSTQDITVTSANLVMYGSYVGLTSLYRLDCQWSPYVRTSWDLNAESATLVMGSDLHYYPDQECSSGLDWEYKPIQARLVDGDPDDPDSYGQIFKKIIHLRILLGSCLDLQ